MMNIKAMGKEITYSDVMEWLSEDDSAWCGFCEYFDIDSDQKSEEVEETDTRITDAFNYSLRAKEDLHKDRIKHLHVLMDKIRSRSALLDKMIDTAKTASETDFFEKIEPKYDPHGKDSLLANGVTHNLGFDENYEDHQALSVKGGGANGEIKVTYYGGQVFIYTYDTHYNNEKYDGRPYSDDELAANKLYFDAKYHLEKFIRQIDSFNALLSEKIDKYVEICHKKGEI